MEKVTIKAAQIFKVLNKVQMELVLNGGVGKNSRNQFQNYAYRSIDDLQNALSPLMAKHGLLILPEVLDHTMTTFNGTDRGKAKMITHVLVKVKYSLIAVEDGSSYDVVVYGEASDTADKATNKAMSAAFKYMTLQAFCVPTEADARMEADNFHNEIPHQQQQTHRNDYAHAPHHPAQQEHGHQPTGHAPQFAPDPHQPQPTHGAGSLIDSGQLACLRQSLREVGIPEFQFCQKAKIPELDQLPVNRFERAIDWIFSHHQRAA